MWKKIIWKGFMLLICIVGIIGGITLYNLSNKPKEERNSIFSLETPPFIEIASASEFYGQREGTSFLQEEAGISAYVNVGRNIDIEKAEAAFKSVETANDTYIIGEINITGIPEYAHPHAYVHEDGWIVAYYSKNAPVSKIMQWNGYGGGTINTTTLEEAIRKICLAIEIPFSTIKSNIKYYDFEYPNANRMMLIVEMVSGHGNLSDSFTLTIPEECLLYEGSWSHYYSGSSYYAAYSQVGIDGSVINQIGINGGYVYGVFTPQQMEAGVLHTLFVSQYDYASQPGVSGLAVTLIYRTS